MRLIPLVAALASAMLLLGARAQADSFTDVAIPMANNNIQTGLINTFPTSTFTANNGLATTFNVAGNGLTNCGPGGNAATRNENGRHRAEYVAVGNRSGEILAHL